MKLLKKILIANRGEIAVRIIKTAKKLDIKTVAIYSEADKASLFVEMADEAHSIGGNDLADSYLNIEKIIAIANKTGADAIHPGYGFLSENSKFVTACENAGIVFIGPSKEVIDLMGNKIKARNFIISIGAPLIEGATGKSETLLAQSKKLEYPILAKAAAGGGGKGMRIIEKPEDLKEALEATEREAKSYFGDGTVFIERFIESPRHIEIQIIGDNHGNVVHLFERECSIQRRYQKIVEEAPSPTILASTRKKMCEVAVQIGKQTNYNNAGTIEFLVDKHENFYFLEMNTRIQVEHPVTELTTGVDIVEQQIYISSGHELQLKQNEIKQNGHSIECRIYAEDPENNFTPSPGVMTLYHQPEGKNIRIDSGFQKGVAVESFYDPMICKLTTWGEDRTEAIKTMDGALSDFAIHGIKTNISYLIHVLKNKAYLTKQISTRFCDLYTDEISDEILTSKSETDISIPLISYLIYSLNEREETNEKSDSENVWNRIGFWRNFMIITILHEGENHRITIYDKQKTTYNLEFDGKQYSVNLLKIQKNKIQLEINNELIETYVSENENREAYISHNNHIFKLKRRDYLHHEAGDTEGDGMLSNNGNVVSPLPGKVIKINVNQGDSVKRGDAVIVIEAMKMENKIAAGKDAVVDKINVKVGDLVQTNTILLTVN